MRVIDKEKLKEKYEILKIDYRYQEGKRYYIFAYKKNEKEWDIQNGELIYITRDEDLIKELEEVFYCITNDKVVCLNCFKNKDVEGLKNNHMFYGKYVWENLSEENLKELQDQILLHIPDLTWANVQGLLTKENPFVFFNSCTRCMSDEEFDNDPIYKTYIETIEKLEYQIISKSIMNGNEKLLEKYLCDHIEEIEKNMIFLENQKTVDGGVIDILAQDALERKCIIELKTVDNDKRLIWQAAYYQSTFDEEVRVITIAPGYTQKIADALKNIKNVELMVYRLNDEGIIEFIKYDDVHTSNNALLNEFNANRDVI